MQKCMIAYLQNIICILVHITGYIIPNSPARQFQQQGGSWEPVAGKQETVKLSEPIEHAIIHLSKQMHVCKGNIICKSYAAYMQKIC